MPQLFEMGDEGARRAGIAAAVTALKAGRLVAMPTETVYGLAADATNPAAVAALFEAKGRPRFNPLIVHVASVAAARKLARLGPIGEALAASFWPGPLTLVAPRLPGSPIAELATAGLATIAIRVPNHVVAQELLAASGLPLAAPSANRSGHVSPTTARHVAADLGDRVAVILDAGPSGIGVESTIVAVDRDPPALLRPGGLPRDSIEGVLGHRLKAIDNAPGPIAPGMMEAHYAPSVPLRLNADRVGPGESLLAFGRPMPSGADKAVAVVNLSPAGDLREAAANLFQALRSLETIGSPIAAMPIPAAGLGEAINDRLSRAAAPARRS